ncbi:MAG: helix-turn-helix domain-containing protein [Bacillota bacterium]
MNFRIAEFLEENPESRVIGLPGRRMGRSLPADKSYQEMLAEERNQKHCWREISQVILDINTSADSSDLSTKLVQSARKILLAERACLIILVEKKPVLKFYEATGEGKVNTHFITSYRGPLVALLETKTPLMINEPFFFEFGDAQAIKKAKNLLGVPLYSPRGVIGALLVIDKQNGQPFTQFDQDCLFVLGAQAAVALGNALLYERATEELKEKVSELSRLNNVLSSQNAALQKSTTIHNLLTNQVLEGRGLKAITKTLAEIIDNAVIVADKFLYPMFYFPEGETEDREICKRWREVTADPVRQVELSSLFKGKRSLRLPFTGEYKSKEQFVVLPILAGQDHLGFVATVEGAKKLKELDYIALEHAATVIALELLKQKAAFETELRLRKDFLEELLDGNYSSDEGVTWRARQFGLDLGRIHRVAVLEIGNGDASPDYRAPVNLLEIIDRAIKAVEPLGVLVERKKEIVFILPQVETVKREEKIELLIPIRDLEKEFSHCLRGRSWWIGIGAPCLKAADFSRSYQEARAGVELARLLGRRNCCLLYERLGVFGLLEINQEAFRKFVQRIIGPLLEYDEKHGSQLLATLELYYKNNCNILKTARKGYLSPSTLKYRLKRIKEIAHLDLNDPEINLQLQLALKLLSGITEKGV